MDIQNPQLADSPQFATRVTPRGRRVLHKTYFESDDDPAAFNDDVEPQALPDTQPNDDDDDDDDEQPVRRRLRTRSQSKQNVVHESDEELKPGPSRPILRSQSKRATSASKNASALQPTPKKNRSKRLTRRSGQQPQQEGEADEYVDHPSSASADEDASFEDAVRTSSEPEPEDPDLDADGEIDVDADADGEMDARIEADGKHYALRQRTTKVNYVIPTLDKPPPKPKPSGRGGGRNGQGGHGANRPKGLGWSATGAELGCWMGLPAEDSVSLLLSFANVFKTHVPIQDSDHGMRTPRKPYTSAAGGMYGGAGLGGGMMAGDLAAAAGTPSNLGKIGDAGEFLSIRRYHSPHVDPIAIADADPLGVNVNVTFDEVGGLDERARLFSSPSAFPFSSFWGRYSFSQGNDTPSVALSRSISTFRCHTPSRGLISRPTWYRQDAACPSTRC